MSGQLSRSANDMAGSANHYMATFLILVTSRTNEGHGRPYSIGERTVKLRVIGLMAFLFAGNVVAEEVQLVCFGSDTKRGEDGSYESVDAPRQVRFDEEAGTFAYTASGKGFKDAKSVKFTEQYITAK